MLRYAAAPLAHAISYPLISDLVRETVPARPPRCPLSTEALGAARHDVRSENQRRACPRASRKEDNGADRRSDHSDKTQQGAQQPAGTKNLRETNVELREENPKTSPENLINTFCGAP